MNIVERAREIFKKQSKLYFEKIDSFTETITYFEMTIDENKKPVSCKVINNIPKDVPCQDYYDVYAPYNSLLYKTNNDYLKNISTGKDFFDTNMYNIPSNEWSKELPFLYNKYTKVLREVEIKCEKNGISTLGDSNKIFQNAINEINEFEKLETSKHISGDYYKCNQINLDGLSDEVLETINDRKFNSTKFIYYNRMIGSYISSFRDDFPILEHILEKDHLNDKDKIVLAKYSEFLDIVPELYDLLKLLNTYAKDINIQKEKYNMEKYKSNNDFIASINGLVSHVNNDEEDLYIHVTGSSEAALNILQNGLYTFGSLDSFSFPFKNVDQILKYEYGSDARLYDSFVVVFRVKKDAICPMNISEEEANEAMKHIDMRRITMITTPSGKIPNQDILGIIDKKNMKVISNPNFISEQFKR